VFKGTAQIQSAVAAVRAKNKFEECPTRYKIQHTRGYGIQCMGILWVGKWSKSAGILAKL